MARFRVETTQDVGPIGSSIIQPWTEPLSEEYDNPPTEPTVNFLKGNLGTTFGTMADKKFKMPQDKKKSPSKKIELKSLRMNNRNFKEIRKKIT